MRHVVGIASLAFTLWLLIDPFWFAPTSEELAIKGVVILGVLFAALLVWVRPRASALLFFTAMLVLAAAPSLVGASRLVVRSSLINAAVAAVLTMLSVVAAIRGEKARAEAARQAEAQSALLRRVVELEQTQRTHLAELEQLRRRDGLRSRDI